VFPILIFFASNTILQMVADISIDEAVGQEWDLVVRV
jgi:hypothetical protein